MSDNEPGGWHLPCCRFEPPEDTTPETWSWAWIWNWLGDSDASANDAREDAQ